MLSRITLENFFSFKGPTTIDLNPGLNILLGINSSGKSNLFKAIHLLYEAIIGNGLESLFLKTWGGFPSVSNFTAHEKDVIKLSFEFNAEFINGKNNHQGFQFRQNPIYDLTIYRVGPTSYGVAEKLYCKTSPNPDFIFMKMSNGQGIISTREEGEVSFQKYPQENQQVTFKSTEPVLRQISDPERFYPLFTLKRTLESVGVYSNFDTTFSSLIRQPASYGTETKLFPDGQNLMTIINKIKNNHSLSYEKIEEAIQKINPLFKDINFDFIGSKLYLVIREKNLIRSVSIEQISDGTLRYLLLLSVLFNPERGNLICLEEPETNLHPDMINTIAEALKQASKETQIMLTTHSPFLLNLFDLEDVLVFEKNEGNETVVNYSFPDEVDEDFLVGQAWLQGLIGGKRW